MLNDDRPITPDMDYLAAAANAKNKAIPTSYLRRKAV